MTYLDHAATTPIRPGAAEAMSEALTRVGNASSLHAAGRGARKVVEECRERIALALGAHTSEVIFTGGGTEADNLAIKGIYWARRPAHPAPRPIRGGAREHHAVVDAVEWLAGHQGAEIEWLPVDEFGRVRPEAFEAACADPGEVALASVMWANNEVGTVNPVAELARIAGRGGVPVHSDAVQAVGVLPIDFASSGLGALAVSGHKIGGPLGVGVLLLGRDTPCDTGSHGGGQERDVRSGTLDVPAIVGLAAALDEAVADRTERTVRLGALRDRLVAGVLAAVPDAVLNGAPTSVDRLPGNAHLSFPGCDGDGLLMLLDAEGVCCSTGSACTAGVARPSHVLLAMGVDETTARGSLRFTLGHTSTEADVEALTRVIGRVVDRARGRRKVSG
jgi:cysteine desulfurase